MRKITILLIGLLLISVVAMAAENNLTDLRTQVNEMIEILESNEPEVIKQFIQTYALPEDLEKIEITDELITGFIKSKKVRLLRALTGALETEPKHKDDEKTYVFMVNPRKLIMVYSDSQKSFFMRN